MTSVRKRTWTTDTGVVKAAWQVDYRDPSGKRRAKQFDRKKDADAFATTTSYDVSRGIHTADSQSITVAKAGENWIIRGEREGLEASTLAAYAQHVRKHIDPFLGAKKLNKLTRPMIEEFRDQLLDSGRSRAMAKRVLRSLFAIVKEAQRLGFVAKNVVDGVTVKRSGRERSKATPPSKSEIRTLILAAENARPMDASMLLLLVFAGLRASELRALPWRNVDLKRATITVDQRADFRNVIGPPKSASSFRTIPVPPTVVTALRKWKLRCPKSHLGLVFPSQEGTPIFHANLVLGFQEPLQLGAGITRERTRLGKVTLDLDGKPVREGVYSLHDFRHAAASLWIEQRVAPKKVQTWMGHHSIQVTFDTYGHLFAALDDDAETMASLEAGVLGNPQGALS